MKKNNTQEDSENPSTKQSNAEQLSLFEWAGIPDDSQEKLDHIHTQIVNDFWSLVERSGMFEDSSLGWAVRSGF
jgi:hypothetical protein